jgi:hypothetical protein
MQKRVLALLFLLSVSLAACPANYNISNLLAGTRPATQTPSPSRPAPMHPPPPRPSPTPSPPPSPHPPPSPSVLPRSRRPSGLLSELSRRQQSGGLSFHGRRRTGRIRVGLLLGGLGPSADHLLGQREQSASAWLFSRRCHTDPVQLQLCPGVLDHHLSLRCH